MALTYTGQQAGFWCSGAGQAGLIQHTASVLPHLFWGARCSFYNGNGHAAP